MAEYTEEEQAKVNAMIDDLVEKAKKASEEYMKLDQEQVNNIVKAMSMAGLEHHMELAKLAVEETGRGIYEDKITKNMFATEYIYHSIKYDKTVGVINENEEEGYEEIAEPIGIIAGVTPVTNPTSTTMFKSIIAAKTRNVIIFGFHPSAQKCSSRAAEIVRDAAIKAGAPENCILWIEEPSILATSTLMHHPGVNLILATGGTGMVKAAYSSGKPALGVGPGNVPCYIHKSAKLKTSVNDLVLSKSFDNGMICASEQSVIVDREIHEEFERLMREAGCYFLSDEETNRLRSSMFIEEKGCALNADIVGKSPYNIAKGAGIEVPQDTKVLVLHENGVGIEYPFSKEKLSPVLAYYIVENEDEGINLAEKLIEFGGLGHSAVVHAEDNDVIEKFSETVKVGRIIVNSPSTHGAIGDIYNTNMPSLTLGCGTFGGNSTTSNVSSANLINVKKVAKRRVNMQWFKVPDRIYFEKDSIQYEVYMRMKALGFKNMYYITHEQLGFTAEDLIEGTHPNDVGMHKYAAAYAKVLDPLLIGSDTMKCFTPCIQHRDGSYEWMTRHNEILALNHTIQPEILMIGNSITHFWGGEPQSRCNGGKTWQQLFGKHRVVNMGMGWDRVENVYWRLSHGELEGCRPSQICLLIGINNRADSDERIVSGICDIVALIRKRQPQARLHVVEIYPCKGSEERVRAINTLLRSKLPLDDMTDIQDVSSALILDDGSGRIDPTCFVEGLHPNEKGYGRLARLYRKFLFGK